MSNFRQQQELEEYEQWLADEDAQQEYLEWLISKANQEEKELQDAIER